MIDFLVGWPSLSTGDPWYWGFHSNSGNKFPFSYLHILLQMQGSPWRPLSGTLIFLVADSFKLQNCIDSCYLDLSTLYIFCKNCCGKVDFLLLITHDYIKRTKDRGKMLGRKKNAWGQKVSEENGKHIFTGIGTKSIRSILWINSNCEQDSP